MMKRLVRIDRKETTANFCHFSMHSQHISFPLLSPWRTADSIDGSKKMCVGREVQDPFSDSEWIKTTGEKG
jgi:hypothetical protein